MCGDCQFHCYYGYPAIALLFLRPLGRTPKYSFRCDVEETNFIQFFLTFKVFGAEMSLFVFTASSYV